MASKRVAAQSARETLVKELTTHQGDAVVASEDESAAEHKRKHQQLVREAGRAALEESLLGKRKASESMTAAGIAAQWEAYAEVYGTNGMSAGGGRSSLVGCSTEEAEEEESEEAEAAAEQAKEEEPAAEPAAEEEVAPVAVVQPEERKLALWDF